MLENLAAGALSHGSNIDASSATARSGPSVTSSPPWSHLEPIAEGPKEDSARIPAVAVTSSAVKDNSGALPSAEVLIRLLLSAALRLVPTFRELRAVSGLAPALSLYLRFLTFLAALVAVLSLVVVALLALTLAPSVLLAVICICAALSAPILLVSGVSVLMARLFPTAPHGWITLVTVAAIFPFSPMFSVAFCFALVITAAAFPSIYVLGLVAFVASWFASVLNLSKPVVVAVTLGMLPAIVPNFLILNVLVVPTCFFTCIFWAPAVAIQTWVITFPALGLVLLLRTNAATSKLQTMWAEILSATENVSSVAVASMQGWGSVWLVDVLKSTTSVSTEVPVSVDSGDCSVTSGGGVPEEAIKPSTRTAAASDNDRCAEQTPKASAAVSRGRNETAFTEKPV